MGLGEVGGDGSVQVSVYFETARGGETEAGDGKEVWGRAKARNQLSAKANNISPADGHHAYRGQDTQKGKGDNQLGDFTVTVHFNNKNEVANAKRTFDDAVASGTLDVSFDLAVRAKSPGQIQIEWV